MRRFIVAVLVAAPLSSASAAQPLDTRVQSAASATEQPQIPPSPGSVTQVKPTAEVIARFVAQNEELLTQMEAQRRQREQVIKIVERRVPVDIVTYRWCRTGLFGQRWVRRRIVRREMRSVTESRITESGIEWTDPRVGKTDPNNTTVRFNYLPPTTGARLDFITSLLRRHAIAEIEVENPLIGGLGVALETKWNRQPDGIHERRYQYQGVIVTDLADTISLEVRIKERPIAFNKPDDYVPVSNDDAAAEYLRLSRAIGFATTP